MKSGILVNALIFVQELIHLLSTVVLAVRVCRSKNTGIGLLIMQRTVILATAGKIVHSFYALC